MPAPFDITTVTTNTSTGNQSITVDLGGATPVAAIFMNSRRTALDTLGGTYSTILGFTDGVDDRAIGAWAEDAVGTTDTSRVGSPVGCAAMYVDTNPTIDGRASFVSFGADNVTINWDTAPDNAYEMTVIAIGGSEIDQVEVDEFSAPDSGTISVETPGFEPDMLIMAAADNAGELGPQDSARVSYGFAVNKPTIEQGCISFSDEDAVGTANPHSRVSKTDAIAIIGHGGTVDWSCTVDSFDALGFDIAHDSGTPGADDFVFFIAIKFATPVPSLAVDIETLPDGVTGVTSFDTPGFEPSFVFGAPIQHDTLDNVQTNVAIGLCAFSGTEQFSYAALSDPGATSQTAEYHSATDALALYDHNENLTHKATLDSFDSLGFNLNFSTAGDVGRMLYLAIGTFGNTFDEDISDASGHGDSASAAALVDAAVSDGAGQGAALSAEALIAASLADAVGHNEQMSSGLNIDVSVADSFGHNDIIPGGIRHDMSFADAFGHTEAASATLSVSASISDAIGHTESIDRHLVRAFSSLSLRGTRTSVSLSGGRTGPSLVGTRTNPNLTGRD